MKVCIYLKGQEEIPYEFNCPQLDHNLKNISNHFVNGMEWLVIAGEESSGVFPVRDVSMIIFKDE